MAHATARPPIAVHVAGRWHQGLAVIVATIGLGAAQVAVTRGLPALRLVAVLAGFLGVAVLLFLAGAALLRGRPWGWWVGVIAAGTLTVVLVYATAVAPQAATQRWTATVATVVLFGVPVVLLGLPSARRFFAARGD